MTNEIRRVPANWEHPRNTNGGYVPLVRHSFKKLAKEWDEEAALWETGYYINLAPPGNLPGEKPKITKRDPSNPLMNCSFEDFHGPRPKENECMPDWPAGERTHWQWYETYTEGTPCSPPMRTAETLAYWLANNTATHGMDEAPWQEWHRRIRDHVQRILRCEAMFPRPDVAAALRA